MWKVPCGEANRACILNPCGLNARTARSLYSPLLQPYPGNVMKLEASAWAKRSYALLLQGLPHCTVQDSMHFGSH